MSEIGEARETIPRADITAMHESQETTEGVQRYRSILNNCFDQRGDFHKETSLSLEEGTKVTIWNGEKILSLFLNEPEATNLEAVILGMRPMFFIGKRKSNWYGEDLENFVVGTSNLHTTRVKGTFEACLAVYNPDLVRKVSGENPDVFVEFKVGDSIDEYIDNVLETFYIRLKGPKYSVPDPNNPLWQFDLVDKEVPEGYYETMDDSEGVPIYSSISAAQDVALRVGLLLGYPRDLIEKIVNDRAALIRIYWKIFEQEDKYLSDKNRFGLADESTASKFMKNRRLERPELTRDRRLLAKYFPNLSDAELEILLKSPRYRFGKYGQNTGDVPLEVNAFEVALKKAVRETGIKGIQKEFEERFKSLKMRGLIGVLRSMIGLKGL